ncbi:hypothetical protein TNCV_3221271 [Trichonephila clavipes]|nr:hypothetical protein TNCV_3221271 [Trichonephila clavipes]
MSLRIGDLTVLNVLIWKASVQSYIEKTVSSLIFAHQCRRKRPKVQKPEIEIKMVPHSPKKTLFYYDSEDEDMIVANYDPLWGRNVPFTVLRPTWGLSRRKPYVADPACVLILNLASARLGAVVFISDIFCLKS